MQLTQIKMRAVTKTALREVQTDIMKNGLVKEANKSVSFDETIMYLILQYQKK